MNRNTDYETFARDIYQELLAQDGLTVKVLHNQVIQGKAAKHQIDVFWEFDFAGVKHKVAIECKNYSNNVSIGKVRDFKSIIEDIGNTNGIIVTTKGFQSGAIEFAEHHEIQLIILREPLESDWKGKIRYLDTTIEVHDLSITNTFVKLDLVWFKENFPDIDPKSVNISFTGLNNEMYIVDELGNEITNFLELENNLREVFDSDDFTHFFPFSNGYMNTDDYGAIKIERIELTYETSKTRSKHIFDRQLFIKALVHDIKTGKKQFIKK
ncbi:restriction endonuclease [Kordia jejudonensis]|uniref:restriction endonuclease n=1 Tax=Kordia jejudonensis TaxID=1348245 RepID=UPI00069BA332|nr:restriction endonuclease [Kordia jejudonensis]